MVERWRYTWRGAGVGLVERGQLHEGSERGVADPHELDVRRRQYGRPQVAAQWWHAVVLLAHARRQLAAGPQRPVAQVHHQFETSDGTQRQEHGSLKQISEDVRGLEVQGSYKYSAPDGLVYTVTYVADEHGFQPQERIKGPNTP
ncbi:unnamed protein product [Leptidea sinapis]|uniref:Uncharacterized protein n=1 Tax=Leptidea sinapis TaxID=189913 RepID=A0A5E4QBM6_9NEOP|nr:unnamed protein product [Leptidea sinapis]